MVQTALFMAPIGPMAHKKKVSEKYSPNTYRVISQDAENSQPKMPAHLSPSSSSALAHNILGQNVEGQPMSEYRHNRPNPGSVGFLRQDVKLLNEPVCHVQTLSSRDEQHRWWPHRPNNDPLKVPPHTLDTTGRHDYQYRGAGIQSYSRHTANPNKEPISGAVPALSGGLGKKQRFWNEDISYEHQYNSRLDPSYPIRAKRHGSFVWKPCTTKQMERISAQQANASVSPTDAAQAKLMGNPSANSPKTPASKGGSIQPRGNSTDSVPELPPIVAL